VQQVIAIKVLASLVEFGAAIIFAFALFRIPINYFKVILIALIISILSHYMRSIPDIEQFVPISILICMVILIGVLFSLPFFYSLLISILCILEGALFEFGIMWVGIRLKFTTMDLLRDNIMHSTYVVIGAGCISLVLAYILQTKKIGFMFMAGRFSVRQAVKAYNFAISAVLIIAMVCVQVAAISVKSFNIHGYILIFHAIILLGALYASYKQNRRLLDEKYERLSKR
jgi:hypothetical protein